MIFWFCFYAEVFFFFFKLSVLFSSGLNQITRTFAGRKLLRVMVQDNKDELRLASSGIEPLRMVHCCLILGRAQSPTADGEASGRSNLG